jgi:hypothetical protein
MNHEKEIGPCRSRIAVIVIMMLVIAAGLGLRSRAIPLPYVITKYGGDALWALMVYCAVAWVCPRKSTARVAVMAYLISCVVEISQLFHAPWIDAIRATRLGALAIGSTFNWPDFLAYGVGVGVGAMVELLIIRHE